MGVYIPIKYKELTVKIAKLFGDKEVFLETGIPTIVGTLYRLRQAKVYSATLCTNWGNKMRPGKRGNNIEFYNWCKKQEGPQDLIHPLKPGIKSFNVELEQIFNELTVS